MRLFKSITEAKKYVSEWYASDDIDDSCRAEDFAKLTDEFNKDLSGWGTGGRDREIEEEDILESAHRIGESKIDIALLIANA